MSCKSQIAERLKPDRFICGVAFIHLAERLWVAVCFQKIDDGLWRPRRIDVSTRMDARLDRRVRGRRIERADRPARLALSRRMVDLARGFDGLLLQSERVGRVCLTRNGQKGARAA